MFVRVSSFALAVGLLGGCPPGGAPTETSAAPSTTGATTEGMPTGTGSGTSAADTSTTGSDTTTASNASSTGRGSTGGVAVCGDGVVDADEDCDDGNELPADGCLPGCVLGPGGALPPLVFPVDPAVRRFWLTGEPSHALVLGGVTLEVGPEGEAAGLVERRPLPGFDPATWTRLELAGIYDRLAIRGRTAGNGDVVVVGHVSKEQVKPDAGAYLWLARFGPDGSLVWSFDMPEHAYRASELELTGADEPVVLGLGWSAGAVLKFDSGGALQWERVGGVTEELDTFYQALAVDPADGTIFVGGTRRFHPSEEVEVFFEGRTAAGDPVWSRTLPKGMNNAWAGVMVRTTDDRLVVTVIEQTFVGDTVEYDSTLVALSAAGELLGSTAISPVEPGGSVYAGHLVALDGGDVVLTDDAGPAEAESSRLSRLDAAGEPVWVSVLPATAVHDAALGPDGLLYVLTEQGVVPVLP